MTRLDGQTSHSDASRADCPSPEAARNWRRYLRLATFLIVVGSFAVIAAAGDDQECKEDNEKRHQPVIDRVNYPIPREKANNYVYSRFFVSGGVNFAARKVSAVLSVKNGTTAREFEGEMKMGPPSSRHFVFYFKIQPPILDEHGKPVAGPMDATLEVIARGYGKKCKKTSTFKVVNQSPPPPDEKKAIAIVDHAGDKSLFEAVGTLNMADLDIVNAELKYMHGNPVPAHGAWGEPESSWYAYWQNLNTDGDHQLDVQGSGGGSDTKKVTVMP